MEDIKHIKKVRQNNNIYYPYYDKYTKSLCIPMVAGQTVYYLEIPRSVILESLKDEEVIDDTITVDSSDFEDVPFEDDNI